MILTTTAPLNAETDQIRNWVRILRPSKGKDLGVMSEEILSQRKFKFRVK